MEMFKLQQNKLKLSRNTQFFYCKKCLSLRIKLIGDLEYCDKCGSTNIDEAHINYWDKLYRQKYGKPYLNIEQNGRKRS